MKGFTKQIFETGKEVLVALGVHTVLKDQAAQALRVHFMGVGKNDEKIFGSTFINLGYYEQQGIENFIKSLEDWQQVQFIYFVAGMPGPSSPSKDDKGNIIPGKPGERLPFLEKLAQMKDDTARLEFLKMINFFSPISMDRLLFEIKQGGKKLIEHLQNVDWQKAKTAIKKIDMQKVASWRDQLADAIEKSANKGRK